MTAQNHEIVSHARDDRVDDGRGDQPDRGMRVSRKPSDDQKEDPDKSEGELLLPAVESVVRELDLEEGRMVVRLLSGMQQEGGE